MLLRFLFILFCLLASVPTHGAETPHLEDLLASLNASIHDETLSIQNLSSETLQEKQMETAMQSESRAYRILMASHRNLLLSSHTPLSELEKARADQQTALTTLDTYLQRIQRQEERLTPLLRQTEQRKQLTLEQKTALTSGEEKNPEIDLVQKTIEKLLILLKEKAQLLESLMTTQEQRRQEVLEIRKDMENLFQVFQQTLRERRTLDLFQKSEGFRALLDPSTPLAVFLQIRNSILRLLTPSFWLEEIRPLFQLPPATAMRILVLGLFLLPLALRMRSFLRKQETLHSNGWRAVFLETSRKALPLLVLAIFTETMIRSQPTLSGTGLFKVITGFTWFLALFRLLTAFSEACGREGRPSITPDQLDILKKFTRLFFLFTPLFILSLWIFPQGNPLILMERILLEICVVILVFRFWSRPTPSPSSPPTIRTGLHLASKAIALGAPALELLGYGFLALFWYWAWGVTFIISGTYLLFFTAVREWVKAKGPSPDSRETSEGLPPLTRLGVRMLPFMLLPLFLFIIAQAWGLHESLFPLVLAIFRYPVNFGGMEFSLLRLFQALCVLLLTLVATRSFRAFIEKRILMESGVEQGLRTSILTLIGYLIWGFGILSALHVFGLNTTSLTVAFGALGVGLGFGLQAIFNNFVSGIILLFERPIQVGDVIEIDGIWGVVTRINVRSTVVQTYDNASLIIPNANFISSRLTNWSFKDQRLRKHIDVGVSYSSDVKRVEKVLLEIAANTKGVLTYPAPDVHFMDFGDSALVFRLRFWSTLQEFRKVETQIRFAITLEFRKEGIEIPFPQQDLHLRSDYRFDTEEKRRQESRKPEGEEKPMQACEEGPLASGPLPHSPG